MTTFRFVDCQGFAGGMACGAKQAGFTLVGKLERPGGFGVSLMEANRVFLGDAWQTQVGPATSWEPVETDVVVGTPPCSAFSHMTHGMASHGAASKINDCMWDLFRYAAKVSPAAVVMESVPAAYTQGRELTRELVESLSRKTRLAYRTTHVVQDNYSLGGATRRKRYFLVVSQVPFGVEVPRLDRLPTVGDAIGDLVSLPLTPDPQSYDEPATWYSAHLRSRTGVVDGHWTKPNKFTRRLADIHAGAGWDEGEREAEVLNRYYLSHDSLPESYQYETPGKTLTRDKQLLERGLDPGGFNQTRAWPFNEPGRVISGAGPYMVWNAHAGRLLTNRECARVMGFPDSWVVGMAKTDPKLPGFWGKGTSVHPATWVMDWLNRSLNGEPGEMVGELDESDGSRFIDVSRHWKTVNQDMAA